jgi:hypothetical protein
VTAGPYPLWFAFSASLCAVASGTMLMAADHEGLRSQAWLAAASFGLWSLLAAVCFWETA